MGFLKRLFDREPKPYVDERGLYFYVDCDNCHNVLRVRIDRQYDLNNEGGSYSWHKTLVCPSCYRKMVTTMTFDSKFQPTAQEIKGGKYVDEPTSA